MKPAAHWGEIHLEKEYKNCWELSLTGSFSLCFNQEKFDYEHIITLVLDIILPLAPTETEEMGNSSAFT